MVSEAEKYWPTLGHELIMYGRSSPAADAVVQNLQHMVNLIGRLGRLGPEPVRGANARLWGRVADRLGAAIRKTPSKPLLDIMGFHEARHVDVDLPWPDQSFFHSPSSRSWTPPADATRIAEGLRTFGGHLHDFERWVRRGYATPDRILGAGLREDGRWYAPDRLSPTADPASSAAAWVNSIPEDGSRDWELDQVFDDIDEMTVRLIHIAAYPGRARFANWILDNAGFTEVADYVETELHMNIAPRLSAELVGGVLVAGTIIKSAYRATEMRAMDPRLSDDDVLRMFISGVQNEVGFDLRGLYAVQEMERTLHSGPAAEITR